MIHIFTFYKLFFSMQEYKPNKYDIATQPDGLGYLVRPHDSLKVFFRVFSPFIGRMSDICF